MSQMAYWPWPPDCLTWRPCPSALPVNVSRSGTITSRRSTLTPKRALQPVERHLGVGLAHHPEHQLAGLRVLLDAQARVLGGEPAERGGELVLVGLGRGLDRDRQQRLGHRPRLEHQRLVDAGEGVAGLGPRQPADVGEVARDHAVGRHLLAAERMGQGADPLVLVVVVVAGALAEERREVAGDVHATGRGRACRRRPGPRSPARRTGRWWSSRPRPPAAPTGRTARCRRARRPA